MNDLYNLYLADKPIYGYHVLNWKNKNAITNNIGATALRKLIIFIGLIVIAAALTWYVSTNNIISLESIKNFVNTYKTAIDNNLVLYSIIFFVVYILMVSLSIPGAVFFTLLGVLYLVWYGAAYWYLLPVA